MRLLLKSQKNELNSIHVCSELGFLGGRGILVFLHSYGVTKSSRKARKENAKIATNRFNE